MAAFVAYETSHRLRWVQNQYDIIKGKLVTTRSKLEQGQDRLKAAIDKMDAKNAIISDLNIKYNDLLAEKTCLEYHIRMLEEDVKVMKVAAHLKTKHHLFKEFEQHEGSEWDLQTTYYAWEAFISCEDKAEGEANDGDEGQDDMEGPSN